jgi:ATP-dependent helicase/nuclease subunit A
VILQPSQALADIVERMAPNDEQRAILARSSDDTLVSAGAGTGKTRTLVARYLSLLAAGHSLRSIVAVTFTRKAAHEMRNRVREAIRLYLESPGLSEVDGQRWKGYYSELDAARIGTIHSLCAEILRAHPAETGLDPRFEVLEEAAAGLLLGEAREATLAWAATREDLGPLFAEFGERELTNILTRLLKSPADAEAAFAAVGDDPLATWEGALRAAQGRRLASLLASEKWQDAVTVLRGVQPLISDDRIAGQWEVTVTALDAFDRLAAAGASVAQVMKVLAPLETISLTGGRGAAWPGGKECVAEVKAALDSIRRLWFPERDKRNAVCFFSLTLGPRDELLAALIPPLREVFQYARAAYTALKDQQHAVDYDDLEDVAHRLLSTDPGVLARWQGETSALLVDEFQDTNSRQLSLVDHLDGGRGLRFLVGDAKQSIYRFRGADVTVFRAVKESLPAEAVLELGTSYRAHRALVTGLNALLEPVLGSAADPERPWAAPFGALAAAREEPGPGFLAPHVEMHLAIGTKEEGADERAADALVQRLTELVEHSGCSVQDGKTTRPLDYGDVAILCRAAGGFAAYEDALERAGVPFLTVAGKGFYERPEVRDVLNALRAISDPTDDLAMVGLLRSPAVALSDAGIFRLRDACRAAARPMTLWEALQALGASLPGPDGPRAARAAQVLAPLGALVGRVTVADLLKRLLDSTAYPAALLHAHQARAARNLDKLLDDARNSQIVSVGQFLDYVAELRDSGAREGEARTLAEGSVQLMTVHAAKGLEFPVVVIGDAGYRLNRTDGLLLDRELGPLAPLRDEDKNASVAHTLGKDRETSQEKAENARLLYVAATRAMERLIISGCVTLRKGGTLGSQGWLEDLLPICGLDQATPPCDPEGDAAHDLLYAVQGTPVRVVLVESGWTAPERGATTPPAPRPAAWQVPSPLVESLLAPADASAEEPRPADTSWDVVPRPGTRAPAWVLGEVVHEALAAWRGDGDDLLPWLEARGRGYGIDEGRQLQRLASDAARLLRRFWASELFGKMDGAERRLHEVPYQRTTVDGSDDWGTIDALYRHGGTWTIVEFKTDYLRESWLGRGADRRDHSVRRLRGYVQQTRRYVATVTDLLGERPAALLCLLNYDDAQREFTPDALEALLR